MIEKSVLLLKLDKVIIPNAIAVVGFKLALALKERNSLEHDLTWPFVGIKTFQFPWIQEKHGSLL
jgi:hypothetical protein